MTATQRFFEVSLPVPLRQTFSYQTDNQGLPIGARVRVPFGQRQLVGYVVAEQSADDLGEYQVKEIIEVIDQQTIWTDDIWQLIVWSADYYHHSLGEVAANALPVLLRKGNEASYPATEYWRLTEAGKKVDLEGLKRAPKQIKLLQTLAESACTRSSISEQGISRTVMTVVADKGWITSFTERDSKTTSGWEFGSANQPLTLNKQQAVAVTTINQQQRYAALLLQGVTGSGKTEVYLQAMTDVLQRQQQVLVLVPEIGLTPQTLRRFQQRFDVPIVMLHSGLSDSERLKAWLDSRSGKAAIIIGTRSAVFTPCKNLGMIIIDEEHDLSFKQQDGFRYHARDVAVKRAQLLDIPIVLGTATPALETLNNAVNSRFHWLKLDQRAGGAENVKHQVLDLKQQTIEAGVSAPLQKQIGSELERGNQVLLFLNRRGFAPALMCHECGWIAQCKRCDAYYTVHKTYHQLHCHHCGSQRPIAKQCGDCGSTHLITHGVGTEQLEQSLQKQFPDYGVLRIDRDSTRRKGELGRQLQAATDNRYQILVGTQMLAKGHHFPDVTLVALLDVDGALYSADFRASERLAQLFTQVAGRAGRARKAGKVVLQTHHPEHDLIQDLLNNGYQDFALTALAERQMSLLPPFGHMALFRAEAVNRQHVVTALQELAQLMPIADGAQLLGPMPALMERKAGRYRYQLTLHCRSRKLRYQLLEHLLPQINELASWRKIRWSLDVDPQDFT
ncbi:primosomal protein N' [Idiomarina seosinensis]|uniref:Replication restart protein PriA n=1 Tax=Idiomarina seosinensis TaxID=281739 RepID=A0A432Z6V4_9GAMM|nr:primosomal protein N' [Idiomarina seosinensis]RUO73616.1 primosomal protein N' [Idiomarina seosinensis]